MDLEKKKYQAEPYLNKTIEIDNLHLKLVAAPDKKAELPWSIAKTLDTKKNKASAIDEANQVKEIAGRFTSK